MKPNEYLTEEQARYIVSVKTGSDLSGIPACMAHEIVVLENTIKNFVDAITHVNERHEMMSQKHNDNSFRLLVSNVDRRDEMLKICGVGR